MYELRLDSLPLLSALLFLRRYCFFRDVNRRLERSGERERERDLERLCDRLLDLRRRGGEGCGFDCLAFNAIVGLPLLAVELRGVCVDFCGKEPTVRPRTAGLRTGCCCMDTGRTILREGETNHVSNYLRF